MQPLTRALRQQSSLRRHFSVAFPAPRFFKDASGKKISPFHDIPLSSGSSDPSIFNFICEIPRGAREKMEISTGEPC